jgi:bacterioferritin
MANEKLITALNSDLALELGAITQYMWHHVMAVGMESPEIKEIFRNISMVEMKHAEAFAERIVYLGGTPATKPLKIKMGGKLKKMIQDDIAGERISIKQYKNHIKLAEKLDDPVTRQLLIDTVKDEEEHDDIWSSILGIKTLAEEKK